jgi:IMP and pyridine-specific 5'-nucleotidase
LHAVNENGPGGWMTSTMYLKESPGNWSQAEVTQLLDVAERSLSATQADLHMRSRVIRKKRSVGLIPMSMDSLLPREALDETVLVVQSELSQSIKVELPFCAFNGGRDVWVDVGNKRVGVQILQSYTGISKDETLHIGDQFLNTGNDFAARDVCPCIWITSPEETTYILKSILRLANISLTEDMNRGDRSSSFDFTSESAQGPPGQTGGVNFSECERRTEVVKKMDVFTGELIEHPAS